MLGTIIIGSCVSIQGELVNRFPDGRISVRVGDRLFTGRSANPVEPVTRRVNRPVDFQISLV